MKENDTISPIKDKRIFFPNLDGLRFVAFLMAFLWHALKAPFDLLQIQNPWIHQFFYFFFNGKTGVSIFFVLSGFLITYLILAEVGLNNRLDVIKFYIRRSLRIWPLYFLVLILVFVVMRLVMGLLGFDWSEFDMRPWYYFLFIGNFDVLHIYLAQGADLLPSTVTWSVAIEEQFYLIWPLLFAIVPVRLYKFIFPVVLIASYVFRSLHADSIPVLNFHTLSVCGDLAIGGWAAYFSYTSKSFVNIFASQSAKLRASIYCAGIIILYLLQFIDNNWMHVFGRLAQTLFFAYTILDQNFSGQTSMKFSGSRLMSFWGKYTYGLYLWHPMVLLVITMLFTRVFHLSLLYISTHLLIAAAGLIGSFVTSFLSYKYVEAYFLKMKIKFAFISKSDTL